MPAKKPKISVPCAACNQILERHPCRIAKTKRHFCGPKCRGVWQSQQIGEKHPRWVSELAAKCDNCGTDFRQSKAKQKRNRHNFCCAECSRRWMAKNDVYVGENNHNWKGGSIDYYGPNWYRQARKARERDSYKCRHCGKSEKKIGRRMDVHHIIPFRMFRYIRHQNDNYKEANHLSNLICLCQQCHKKAEAQLIPIQPSLLP
jgi:hypothetical protein